MSTGPTGSTGPTESTTPMDGTAAPPPPDILTFADIANEHSVVAAKEQVDGDAIRLIGTMSVVGLKPAFVEWYMKGCPNCYPVYRVTITPPPKCSDGVVRTLPDYIEFCSGAPIQTHVGLFQAKLPDIQATFANLSGDIAILVSKA